MGSFEVGALQAFVDLLDPLEVQYDVVTGVSVGSINSMALALHEIGQEKQCISWMTDLWLNMSASDIYRSWTFGVLQGLTLEEGIYNNAHEVEFLTGIFNQFKKNSPILKRKLVFSTVDIDTGERVVFDETGAWEDFPKKIVASTSMPFAFTHMHFNNHSYVDGGSIWNVDISSGIERCQEDFDDKDIIIDIILCDGLQVAHRNDSGKYNTIQNYMRYQSIKSFYSLMSDVDEIRRGYPNVNFRYLVYPHSPLPSGFIPLGFKHDDIVKMIQQGYEEAKAEIDSTKGSSFDRISEILDKLYNVYDPEQMSYLKSNN